MKRLVKYFVVLLMSSCDSEHMSPHSNFDTFIQGRVNEKLSDYPQVNLENVNVSNTYFVKSKQTWLQAYKNNRNATEGYWQIRFYNLDIFNLTLPYTTTRSEAGLHWYDTEIVTIDDDRCGGVDEGCSFIGSPVENLEMIITDVTEEYITGRFSGRLFLTGTGHGPFTDQSKFIDVSDGSFKIGYRIDHE